MNNFKVGVKIYKSDWLLKFQLSPQQAARVLKDWGVDFVLTHSRYLSMPADKSNTYTKKVDQQFREALAQEGIDYWATVCTFYNPDAVERNPAWRPVGTDGKPAEPIDWYIGIAPTMDDYVAEQIAAIDNVVQALQPEGVFLSFTRWPGFWELWMPDMQRQDFAEYSYDPKSLTRFEKECGIKLPSQDPAEAAAWIEVNARQQWTQWKCDVVTGLIRQVREASREIKPDVQIMLNTLPFRASDFDNAREKVFGQQVEKLTEVVDIFEVMTYHQILRQTTTWIPSAGAEVKDRTGHQTICTIQVAPTYLDGIYASQRRKDTVSAEEFTTAVLEAEAAGLDGIAIYRWSDLLKAVYLEKDTQRIDTIQAAKTRRQKRLN